MGEKAVYAADYNLVRFGPDNGLAGKLYDHLDGPVSSNGTDDEADAGQMSYCVDASSGFYCEGNRFTAFTENPKE